MTQLYRVILAVHYTEKLGTRIVQTTMCDTLVIGDATDRMQFYLDGAQDGLPIRAWLVPA